MKTAFRFRLWSSENQIVGVGSRRRRTKPITKRGNVHSDWLILPLLLPTPTIWFSLDHKRNVSDGVVSGVGRKWKRSDSSDSNSVALLTPLTTPIFDFHKVLSAPTTPLTTPLLTPTPTPSLVKTSLKYSVPSQWVPVLAPAYSLPLTGRIGVHTTLRFLFRDRRGAASELRDRNRGPTTAQICEQKSYPVWFSWRCKSCSV